VTTYTPEFLTALASEAKRRENYWNNAAAEKTGDDPVSKHVAQSFRNRALEYRGIHFDAMSALDGCEASVRGLDAYFAEDHLLLWRECAAPVRRAAA
jgi:hypothetical protein